MVIELDGRSLTCADVAAIGRGQAQVKIAAAGRKRAGAAAVAVRSMMTADVRRPGGSGPPAGADAGGGQDADDVDGQAAADDVDALAISDHIDKLDAGEEIDDRGASHGVYGPASLFPVETPVLYETTYSRAANLGVYGRTTGVGVNRRIFVDADDQEAHGMRLARSHAGGAGPLLAPEVAIAMLAVRANQLAAGGSGVDPGVLDVLADCVNAGLRPPARRYGAIGTGDLPALAVTILCLLGERDWLGGPDQPRFPLDPADTLAFMSSNAATLAESAIACADLGVLLQAGTVVAALSHLAARASAEPYSEPVQYARGRPGQAQVAAQLRFLLEGATGVPERIQDNYGYRALPQVHGAAVEAAEHATDVVSGEMNAAAENPLVDAAGERFWHNGNFHGGYVALALDGARAAVYQAAGLSAARLSALMDPAVTGLAPFLAGGPAASSGLLVCEYTAQSALADIRRLAAPVVLGGVVISLGAEEHAGFATQAAWSSTGVVEAYRVVLACELVAAVRALRQQDLKPASNILARAFELADGELPAGDADRPLDGDLAAAGLLLDGIAGAIDADIR